MEQLKQRDKLNVPLMLYVLRALHGMERNLLFSLLIGDNKNREKNFNCFFLNYEGPRRRDLLFLLQFPPLFERGRAFGRIALFHLRCATPCACGKCERMRPLPSSVCACAFTRIIKSGNAPILCENRRRSTAFFNAAECSHGSWPLNNACD